MRYYQTPQTSATVCMASKTILMASTPAKPTPSNIPTKKWNGDPSLIKII